MNVQTRAATSQMLSEEEFREPLKFGQKAFRPFTARIAQLTETLEKLGEIGDKATKKTARRLQQQLVNIEPSITMIGQVKAGKTTLVNALVGNPGLLPADVNPWTSVVTSVHMRPDIGKEGTGASFRFFDENDWNRLLERGGRIGELAKRTGAEDELDELREQVIRMREKSKSRLGKKFELLLGQQHDYGYFDNELIERYVCLGDDFEDLEADTMHQGRFADITKSADLFMERNDLPVALCVRDTPGVNDTFMMREQITIRAIRESRICVLVLSAHQALSSVDMALIRLIANVSSREVLIFVNRIDELSDPARQVPEIRDSIRQTLKEHHGPHDAKIIFGSAHWACQALSNNLSELPSASTESLMNWAEQELKMKTSHFTAQDMVWELSGLPALYEAVAERIVEGIGNEAITRVAKHAMNLANGISAGTDFSQRKAGGVDEAQLDIPALEAEFDVIEKEGIAVLEKRFAEVEVDFSKRLDRANSSFIERATASLIRHLEAYGGDEVWQYDPTGLRVLLRSAYQVFTRNAGNASKTALQEAADRIGNVYLDAFEIDDEEFGLEMPAPPRIEPPVMLGQTIALDLKGGWWNRWWYRRRGYNAYAAEFGQMIVDEVQPIVASLRQSTGEVAKTNAIQQLREFVQDQRTIFFNVASQAESADEVDAADAPASRRAELDDAKAKLTEFAA